MKKSLTLLALFLSFISSFAQINNSIWGFSLGQTRSAQFISYLANHKMEYSCIPFTSIYEIESLPCTSVNFGGIKWDMASFEFDNDILSEVGFENRYDNFSSLQDDFLLLRTAFLSKYEAQTFPFADDKDCISSLRLKDTATIVVLIKDEDKNKLFLSYTNVLKSTTEEL